MKILADENIARLIVDRLQQEGHQVRHIKDIARGSIDSDILEMANQQGEILLTDDKDFGDLIFQQRLSSSGVILLRLEGVPLLERAEMVIGAIHENGEELLHAFTVIKIKRNRTIRILTRQNRPETS